MRIRIEQYHLGIRVQRPDYAKGLGPCPDVGGRPSGNASAVVVLSALSGEPWLVPATEPKSNFGWCLDYWSAGMAVRAICLMLSPASPEGGFSS
jgi:hypothetical protein